MEPIFSKQLEETKREMKGEVEEMKREMKRELEEAEREMKSELEEMKRELEEITREIVGRTKPPNTFGNAGLVMYGRSARCKRDPLRIKRDEQLAENLKYSPEEYFTQPRFKGEFGSFDNKGFPTSLADGTPLTKSRIKTLSKELEKQRARWEKHNAHFL